MISESFFGRVQMSGLGLSSSRLRTFVLATLLVLSFGALAAASASADGTIVAIKGGDRDPSQDAVQGDNTYALPLSGITFEYTTDNTLPQTGWTDFTSIS